MKKTHQHLAVADGSGRVPPTGRRDHLVAVIDGQLGPHGIVWIVEVDVMDIVQQCCQHMRGSVRRVSRICYCQAQSLRVIQKHHSFNPRNTSRRANTRTPDLAHQFPHNIRRTQWPCGPPPPANGRSCRSKNGLGWKCKTQIISEHSLDGGTWQVCTCNRESALQTGLGVARTKRRGVAANK